MTRQPTDRWSMAQVSDFLAREPGVAIHPAPVGAAVPDGTQVMPATPSAPVPSQPMAFEPVPPEPAVARRRGRSPWPWVAAAAVALVVAVIAGAVFVATRGDSTPRADAPASAHSSRAASSPSSPSSADAQAAEMRAFIEKYLSTVTTDQHASWAMLTTGFQQESGGFGQYQRFWRGFTSATPRNIAPEPADLTVSYDVDYVKTDGSTSNDHVTLELVRNGASYLINGES
jgi:hypothetical protein